MVLTYHIKVPLFHKLSWCSDLIYLVDDFLELLALDLDAVAVHDDPRWWRVALADSSELVLTDPKVLGGFFDAEGVLLPYWYGAGQVCSFLSSVGG